MARNLCPGPMTRSLRPALAVTVPSFAATALERPDRRRADGDDTPAIRAGRGDRRRRGCGDLVTLGGNLCSASDAVRTGRKVAGPTMSVSGTQRTPRHCSAATSAGVKWRPAVGAAIAPGVRANIV